VHLGVVQGVSWGCWGVLGGIYYDKVSKAVNFQAFVQKIQLKNLESKVTISIIRRDMVTFAQES